MSGSNRLVKLHGSRPLHFFAPHFSYGPTMLATAIKETKFLLLGLGRPVLLLHDQPWAALSEGLAARFNHDVSR